MQQLLVSFVPIMTEASTALSNANAKGALAKARMMVRGVGAARSHGWAIAPNSLFAKVMWSVALTPLQSRWLSAVMLALGPSCGLTDQLCNATLAANHVVVRTDAIIFHHAITHCTVVLFACQQFADSVRW